MRCVAVSNLASLISPVEAAAACLDPICVPSLDANTPHPNGIKLGGLNRHFLRQKRRLRVMSISRLLVNARDARNGSQAKTRS